MSVKRERRPGRAPCLIKLDLADKKCLYGNIAETEPGIAHDMWIKPVAPDYLDNPLSRESVGFVALLMGTSRADRYTG